MEDFGVISHVYDDRILSELNLFMHNSDFLWSDENLMDYIAKQLTHRDEEQLLVKENGLLVGCNLFMSSYASIRQKIESVKWSHSTLLKSEYRKKYGLNLVLRSYELKNVFGFGLTDINIKIHKRLGSKFFYPSLAYLMKIDLSKKTKTILSENKFEIGPLSFKRIHASDEINYPQYGIWNGEKLNVDFVRDKDFIQKRFFSSPYQYCLYAMTTPFSHDRLYFVTRIRTINKERCLFLVDYRYSLEDHDAFGLILSALEMIAKHENIERCFFFSSIKFSMDSTGKAIERYGESCAIVTNIKDISDDYVFVTPADSDSELIPFDKDEKNSE